MVAVSPRRLVDRCQLLAEDVELRGVIARVTVDKHPGG